MCTGFICNWGNEFCRNVKQEMSIVEHPNFAIVANWPLTPGKAPRSVRNSIVDKLFTIQRTAKYKENKTPDLIDQSQLIRLEASHPNFSSSSLTQMTHDNRLIQQNKHQS